MTDYINKIVTLIMIFVLLVLAPINLSYIISDGTNKRLILNEAETFLDEVTSKGEVTEDDINNIYMRLNSYGMVIDVKVERLVRTAVTAPDGKIKTMYTAADPNEVTGNDKIVYVLNKGDLVRMQVKEIVTSPANKMIYKILGVSNANLDFPLTKVVN